MSTQQQLFPRSERRSLAIGAWAGIFCLTVLQPQILEGAAVERAVGGSMIGATGNLASHTQATSLRMHNSTLNRGVNAPSEEEIHQSIASLSGMLNSSLTQLIARPVFVPDTAQKTFVAAQTCRPATSRETARSVLERVANQVLTQKERIGTEAASQRAGEASLSKVHASMNDMRHTIIGTSVDSAESHRPALRRMESLDLAIPQRGTDGILRVTSRDPEGITWSPTVTDGVVKVPIYFCHSQSMDAQDVTVVGSWSAWKDHFRLRRNGKFFDGVVDVPVGEHQFKFIVDGQWSISGQWPVLHNEFGDLNNVITIPQQRFAREVL